MTKKITDLDPALPLTGAEVTPLVQNAVTRRSTLSALADWVLKTYAGFLQAGTGAVPRTLQSKSRDFVSVFDWFTESEILDVSSGTLSINVTAKIQSALDSLKVDTGNYDLQLDTRGGALFFPPGRYLVSGNISLKAGCKIIGSGRNVSVLVSNSPTNNVISHIGNDGGSVDPINISSIGISILSGITPISGFAISIDGNSYGTSVIISDVMTQDTFGGIYFDWTFPSTLTNVLAMRHVNSGFSTRFNCTSTSFINCYAGACGGSGYVVAGGYMSMVSCASDSNALYGYHFNYDGGASRSISTLSCGGENNSLGTVYVDRVTTATFISPTCISALSTIPAIILAGGCGSIEIINPTVSCTVASSVYAIDLVQISSLAPSSVKISGGINTNFVGMIDQNGAYIQRIQHFPTANLFGQNLESIRWGSSTNWIGSLQNHYFNSNLPVGVGGTAYDHNQQTMVTISYAGLVASKRYKPIINAPFGTVARLVIGSIVQSPTITAGSVTRYEGSRIEEMPAGTSADANIVFGDSSIPVGRWSIANMSTKDNLFYGPIRWGSSTGPTDRFGVGTPEGVITASIGSIYRRTDGAVSTTLYVKESGTGNTGWAAK